MKTITPYMMELHKELQEQRKVSDSTASQYIRTLYKLNSDRPFNNLSWLKNVESVHIRLEDYAESTKKNAISTIVSALSLVKEKPTYKKIYAYWYTEMMERIHSQKQVDTSKKTDKQEENWLSWDVIKGHLSRLHDEAVQLVDKPALSPSQWETVLSYMILSLYTDFAPRRNQDYQLMKVVRNEKQATDQDSNYLVLDGMKFIFNKYKTAKTHGQQVFSIPESLHIPISLYLTLHPLLKGKTTKPLTSKLTAKSTPIEFLVQYNGSPLTAVNAITRILNRVFGKRIGATMLRHIYLSSKYNVDEMNDDAEKMAHSSALQHDYMKGGETQTANIPTT